MNLLSKSIEQITNAKKIAILVHQNADTDALASAIAMRRIICDNTDKFGTKFCIDIFTDTANFNKKDEYLIKNEKINHQSRKKYDLSICLDCSDRQRFSIYDDLIFKKSKTTLNIDHHESNTFFAKNNIVIPKCSSTCEIIYLLFSKFLKLKCSTQTKALLYCGIITDTNNLTQNIGKKTYNVIDEIVKVSVQNGIDIEKIRNHYFKSNTKERNALLARALSSLTYSENGKIAMMKITKQDFNETGASQVDTLGIVNFAADTEGVEVGIIFIKQEDNTYYVSLRSKNDNINVAEIAKVMGGGGHSKVAAFQSTANDNLTDMKAKLTNLCNNQIANAKTFEEDISSLFAEFIEKDELNDLKQ